MNASLLPAEYTRCEHLRVLLVIEPYGSRILAECNQRKSPSLRMDSIFGVPDRIRTYDLRLRKPTLYPAELRVLVDV